MKHSLTLPCSEEAPAALRAGDMVLLSGVIYTARDAAHKRLLALLEAGEPLPFPLRGAALYYTGPCPPPPGRPVGSCGPTTSGRMDSYTPRLLEEGLAIMIGKGPRSPEVCAAIRKRGAVYLAATGGAGALLAGCVRSREIVAFPELGTEAVSRMTVENMPLICAIDCHGGNLYESEPKKYSLPEDENESRA